MTRKQTLETLREILVRRHEALVQALAGDNSLLKELNHEQGGDVVDFASDSAFGELNSQLAEAGSRELRAIDNALSRMQQGSYGKCEACTRNIPLARLQVLPYATFCIQCKRLAEEAGVEPGSVVDWSVILESADPSNRGDLDFNVS
jgi:DnaK suppressor protein